MFRWLKNLDIFGFRVRAELKTSKRLIELLEKRSLVPIYTTTPVFITDADQKQFWAWAQMVICTNEYRWLMFYFRESIIDELIGKTEPAVVMELHARMNMLAIINRYLQECVKKYEASV